MKPIVMYKFGEPTMIQRKDGSYIDNMEEWDEYIQAHKNESEDENGSS